MEGMNSVGGGLTEQASLEALGPRNMLKTLWVDRAKNKVLQRMGEKPSLLGTIKEKKYTWIGHIILYAELVHYSRGLGRCRPEFDYVGQLMEELRDCRTTA